MRYHTTEVGLLSYFRHRLGVNYERGRRKLKAAQRSKAILHLLIEGDSVENNYSAYIPELRLGAIGDTLEEVKENALALAQMETERLRKNLEANNYLKIEEIEIEL